MHSELIQALGTYASFRQRQFAKQVSQLPQMLASGILLWTLQCLDQLFHRMHTGNNLFAKKT
jgi:hypothetical protein